MMCLFSSRRDSITKDLRERARAFASRYGRAPSRRELAQVAQASNFATRPRKDVQALDFDELHAGWADRLASRLGVSLASFAPVSDIAYELVSIDNRMARGQGNGLAGANATTGYRRRAADGRG